MTNISLTGLPENASLTLLARKLKNLFRQTNFRIRELADVYDSDTKQAVIEFSNSFEARNAVKQLNLTVFEYHGNKYPLLAVIEEDRRRHSPYREQRSPVRRDWSFSDRYGGRSADEDYFMRERDRSRSPVRYHSETSKLDMEIELLRKQRLIIEEERKLILERKKLELIREYGPNAVKDLAYMDEERDLERRRRPIRREQVDRRRSSRPHSPPARKYNRNDEGVFLPQFHFPCKKFLKDMNESIAKAAPGKETANLHSLLRVALRKRLAIALEGKPRLKSAEIIRLYRELYPNSTDQELVETTLATLRKGHIYENEEDIDTVMEGKEDKAEENGTDVSGVAVKNSDTKPSRPVTNIKKEPTEKKLANSHANVKRQAKKPNAPTRDVKIERQADELSVKVSGIKNEPILSQEAPTLEETKDASTLSLEAPELKNEEDWPEGETEWNQDI